MNKVIISLLFLLTSLSLSSQNVVDSEGALVRSDTFTNDIYLCFTGHEYVDGYRHVIDVLKKEEVKGSFFLTGDFVRNNQEIVVLLLENGHYVGAHSDKHLLYCDWLQRDSLLFSESSIKRDISENLDALNELGIYAEYFMPPYEWYNKKVVEFASELGQVTVNFSSGTRSNADYTSPDMPNYVSSGDILESIYRYERANSMNGFHLLIHPGTNPKREDKFYLHLEDLISHFKKVGYGFQSFKAGK